MTPITDDQVTPFLGLARWTALKLCPVPPPGHTEDDVTASGMPGLLRALRTWDPERGVQLATWVTWCVRSAVLDWLRTTWPEGRLQRQRAQRGLVRPTVILHLSALGDEGRSWDAPSPAAGPDVTAERRDLARAALRRLPTVLAETLRLYYLEGLTMAEIARRMGVIESTVSMRRKEALEFLRHPFCLRMLAEGRGGGNDGQ